MNYDILFRKITHLCAAMVAAGGSSVAVPLELNDICNEYGLKESEFIVSSNGVLGTAVAPDGTALTAIRSIDEIGTNFGKLRRFDEYCERILQTLPPAEEIGQEIERINGINFLTPGQEILASVILGTGFAALFGSDLPDLIVSVIASVLIALLSRFIKKSFFANTFFTHTVVCLAVELFIIISSRFFHLCTHPESVSLGVIMLLISGLSFSDGLWAMLNKETAIGIYKLNNALTGAMGIVVGVTMPLALVDEVVIHGLTVTAPLWLQLIECMLACGGFAVLCCTEANYVPAAALGAGLSWLVYQLASGVTSSLFLSMAAAAFAVTLYTLAVCMKRNLNPHITWAVGILPLVPGTNLFYMMSAFVSQDPGLMGLEARKLITTCLGISFGLTLGLLLINPQRPKAPGKRGQAAGRQDIPLDRSAKQAASGETRY